MAYHGHPIIAKEQKDIPEWMKDHHAWLSAVDIKNLPKWELKVKMCCPKCEEKIKEEIHEVPGVFDVKADWSAKQVIVVGLQAPNGPDTHAVLKKAKKIHRKAKFVEMKPEKKKADEKKKGEDKANKDDKEGKADKSKAQEKTTTNTHYVSQPIIWGHHANFPASGHYASYPPSGEYRPSQGYPPRYYFPPLPNQSERPYTFIYYY